MRNKKCGMSGSENTYSVGAEAHIWEHYFSLTRFIPV